VTGFHRYAPAIMAWFAAVIVMASVFGAVIWYQGSPVMPEAYGPFVYSVPAWVWVSLQWGLAFLALTGAALNRPTICAVGSFFVALLFSLFAVGASYGGFSEPYLVAASWPGSGLCLLSAVVSWRGRDGAR
jgi:hypothetical protein